MRLTTELCQSSLSFLNPLKERELVLRGHKISAIENLGAAGTHECIDFTDNDIRILENFPLSRELRTLLCARNRIDTLHSSLEKSIPNLTTLMLSQNRIAQLSDLAVLRRLRRLEHLVLADNPVTKQENYRYWLIWLCPRARMIDYSRVRLAERNRAEELFGTEAEPSELAKAILGKELDTTVQSRAVDGETGKELGYNLGAEEREKILEQIRGATSLTEIQRLHKLLESRASASRPSGKGDSMED